MQEKRSLENVCKINQQVVIDLKGEEEGEGAEREKIPLPFSLPLNTPAAGHCYVTNTTHVKRATLCRATKKFLFISTNPSL